MKTVGKCKLWTILGVLVIAAGILIGAVFGFHADPTLSNVKTISVKLEAYDNEARTEAVRNICESELDKAGLKDTYTFKGEVSGLGNEVVYVFSENTDASKLETAQTAIQNSLDAAAEADGNVLKGAFFYVSLHEEKVETVLSSGYLWRGALAAAVILVIEFVYIAVRYKLNMGATAAATSLLSVLLTLAIVALARLPPTRSTAPPVPTPCQPSSRSPRANSTTPVLSLTLINALILLIYIGNHIFQYTISDDLNTESESRLFAVQ